VARGDVAAGLVEEQVRPRFGAADPTAVESHVIDVEIGLGSRLANHDAVDGDSALENEKISAPA